MPLSRLRARVWRPVASLSVTSSAVGGDGNIGAAAEVINSLLTKAKEERGKKGRLT